MNAPATTVSLQFGRKTSRYGVMQEPVPHILVASTKEVHGWWSGLEPYGNRECTAEKLLINPYNGCSHHCLFCYSGAFGGYFTLFRERGVVTVFKDFDQQVESQLDGLRVASCGYLSPVSDPFQPVNTRYELSEKIIKAFVTRNIPVQVTTKGRISEPALNLLKRQEYAYGEVSLLTLDEEKRQRLMAGGAATDELLRNIERLTNAGKFAVCRVDPIIPFVTDSTEEMDAVVREAVKAGAGQIITSCLDIPVQLRTNLIGELARRFGVPEQRFARLYTELMNGRLHAMLEYRQKLFSTMRAICDRHRVPMSLCMEFESLGGQRVRGLNEVYMSSYNCTGSNVPLYVRAGSGDWFEPVEGCRGNCLKCHDLKRAPACDIPELQRAGAWRLKDYRRWSRELTKRSATQEIGAGDGL